MKNNKNSNSITNGNRRISKNKRIVAYAQESGSTKRSWPLVNLKQYGVKNANLNCTGRQ